MADYRSVHDMVQTSLETGGSSLKERLETIMKIDNTWFDGTVTYTFEVVLQTPNASRTATAILREEGESTDLVTLSTNATTPTRLSGSFTYPASPQAAKTFTIWLKSSTGPGDAQLTAGRIIVDQTGTITKRATRIPLGSHFVRGSGPSVVYPTDQQKHWLWESDKWDGTLEIRFETVFRGQDSNPGDVATTFFKNRSSQVPLVSMTNSTTDILRKQSTDISGTIAEVEYEAALALSSGDGAAEAYSASVLIIQTGTPKKSQPVFVIGWDNHDITTDLSSGNWESINATTARAIGQRTAMIDLSKYSAATGITAFSEITAFYTVDSATARVDAINDGTNESGTGGSNDVSRTITNLTPTRQRSSSFVPTNGNRYYGRLFSNVSGTTDAGNCWIVLDINDLAPIAGADGDILIY